MYVCGMNVVISWKKTHLKAKKSVPDVWLWFVLCCNAFLLWCLTVLNCKLKYGRMQWYVNYSQFLFYFSQMNIHQFHLYLMFSFWWWTLHRQIHTNFEEHWGIPDNENYTEHIYVYVYAFITLYSTLYWQGYPKRLRGFLCGGLITF